MSSSNSLQDDISLRMALVMQRRRAQAHAEFVRGREALNMHGLIDDFEDFSFMQQADMRRIRAKGMRTRELQQMETRRHNKAYAQEQMHKEEVYHRQQQQEAIQRTAALRSGRENMQQNAAAAGNFPSSLAKGINNENDEGFSNVTRNRVLLHEQKLREHALVSAHAERMRMDEFRMQNARLPLNPATHARLTGNYPVPHG